MQFASFVRDVGALDLHESKSIDDSSSLRWPTVRQTVVRQSASRIGVDEENEEIT